MPDERQNRVQDWTDLAKKYGHPVGKKGDVDRRILRDTGKSGLTPVITSPDPDSGRRITRRTISEHKKPQIDYQRKRFHGFTTPELRLLEAWNFGNTDQIESRLQLLPIHSVFQKARWNTVRTMPKNRAPVPMLGDDERFWDVSTRFVAEYRIEADLEAAK